VAGLLQKMGVKACFSCSPSCGRIFYWFVMGQTAEQMAKKHQISRPSQDELAHPFHTLSSKKLE